MKERRGSRPRGVGRKEESCYNDGYEKGEGRDFRMTKYEDREWGGGVNEEKKRFEANRKRDNKEERRKGRKKAGKKRMQGINRER